MVLSTANGAVVLASSFSVTTYSAKSRPRTPAVSSVLARALYAAQIVKEQVFVQSGWETLRSPTHQFPSSEKLYQIHWEETASTGKGSCV
nr:hypothetical protein L195_g026532 [Ipomoea trifida]